MKISSLLITLLLICGSAWAADSDVKTAVGGGVGAAAGTAIGQAVGGKTGAIVGGAVGGGAGAAVTTKGDGKTGAIVGGAAGGAAGAAVGQSVGGKTGAVLGAGVGGAAGAAVGKNVTETSPKAGATTRVSTVSAPAVMVAVEDEDAGHEHKKHGRGHAYGHYKNKHGDNGLHKGHDD